MLGSLRPDAASFHASRLPLGTSALVILEAAGDIGVGSPSGPDSIDISRLPRTNTLPSSTQPICIRIISALPELTRY